MQIPKGQTRDFQVGGAANFASQGGPDQGCKIPASARAVSISLSARSSNVGFLTAFAQGAPKPGTNSVSFGANQTETAGSIIALGPTGQISINVSQTATLYGDVTGYYSPEMMVWFNTRGEILRKTSPILAVRKATAVGTYYVDVDRYVGNCYAFSQGASFITSGTEIHDYDVGVVARSIYTNEPTDAVLTLKISC
ncbi:hypothetical protein [Hansschlegelia zhihuaiae]|uniref:Uncharacterized protein n=1 Tax=Hansschlegelia zhihuaiae TaxID=405005 RepID=A0A4Q0M3Q9_9HYPH|nr:hypothetical protein [Hansschlegelia zhihuaiae]RXF67433.1 hypothetical protein EK403_21405 [Hansschlegelia zhihuaiae]